MTVSSRSSSSPSVIHPADRIGSAVRRVGAPVCVGLDPVLDRLPATLRADEAVDAPAAMAAFCEEVLTAIADHVGIVKVQSACFERYGSAGVAALERTMGAARSAGFVTILDAKRGDIGISAGHYAAATQRLNADWVTLNGWLGEEGIEPFLHNSLGGFVLVRTSNPSGATVQCQSLADGRTTAEAMADLVESLGDGRTGQDGYSQLGAVVGATHPAELEGFRARLPQTIMLLPGYGSQGGTAAGLTPAFDAAGLGALVTASRSVIYAFDSSSTRWTDHVRAAAASFAEEVGTAAGWRS